MHHPHILYEPNPDHSHPLRINRLQRKVELVVVWQDLDGTYHTELFTSNTANDSPNAHVFPSPEQGLRAFLQHCPLHDIKISLRDY
jgi:hypothetical protein